MENAAVSRHPFSFHGKARRRNANSHSAELPRRHGAHGHRRAHRRRRLGLNKLEPLFDTLGQEYPYRAWEDLYRDEFTWDHVGYAAHCINCVGNCAFRIYVKDGIVLHEEQREGTVPRSPTPTSTAPTPPSSSASRASTPRSASAAFTPADIVSPPARASFPSARSASSSTVPMCRWCGATPTSSTTSTT